MDWVKDGVSKKGSHASLVLHDDSNGVNWELSFLVNNKELWLYLLIQREEVFVQRDDPKQN